MKTLKIEWKHLDQKGETCNRCYDTGENLHNEIKRLKRTLEPQGIEVEFLETKLDTAGIHESNSILFNDVPIEEILEIEVSHNYCGSCSDLVGSETYCRAVFFEGIEYEDIPAKAIRKAAHKAAGLDEQKMAPNKSDCCSCETGKCC